MRFSSERFVLLVATLFLIPAPGEGQQLQQGINIVERVVAVVGDSMISQTQIDESLLSMEARGWTRPTGAAELLEAKLEILDQLINLQLIVQEAAKDSLLSVSEEELEDRVQVQIDGQVRQFGTLGRLQQALAEQNMTLALYREQQKNLIRQQVLQERYFAKIGRSSANVVVTDEEARAYFDENQDLFPDRPETFGIETIQLEPEATDAAKEVALARADSVVGLLLEGGDFAELAVRFTDEPGDTGGELGWIRKDGSLVEEFEEVAFGIPAGVPSRPVETQFGYHLILVERIRGGERRVRHILFSPEITTSDVEANDARAESFADRLRAGETTMEDLGLDPDTVLLPLDVIAQTSPELAGALQNGQVGDVIGPVTVADPRAANARLLAGLLEIRPGGPGEFSEFNDMIVERMKNERLTATVIEELRSQAYISIRLGEG